MATSRREVWERDGGICQICRKPVALDKNMHIDHIVPKRLGGTEETINLRTTHKLCHFRSEHAWQHPKASPAHVEGGPTRGWLAPRWQISVRLDAVAARNLDAIEQRTGERLAQLIMRLIREEYERGNENGHAPLRAAEHNCEEEVSA